MWEWNNQASDWQFRHIRTAPTVARNPSLRRLIRCRSASLVPHRRHSTGSTWITVYDR